ncbi:MAG: phosphoheptose isomerase [Candidatus Pacebacteria bacterium]|nr:phosphoheptose isomerase [Candidatus Paceibacterota bacterium]
MQKNNSLFEKVQADLSAKGFSIVGKNLEKPWGAYLLIDENQTKKFIEEYFSHINLPELDFSLKMSPKILLVAPDKRLSWQYHHRRREIWTILEGPVEIVTNDNDKLVPGKTFQKKDFIDIKLGERHRLVGLDNWGIVAEIWLHTDPKNPSNEEDIVRVEDDFNR